MGNVVVMRSKGNNDAHAGVRGIDVSHHQGPVNWPAVAQSSVKFSYLRATMGKAGVDRQFARNWAGCRAAGVIRGAYHLLRPENPAPPQVEHFVRTVGELAPGDLPPALDVEWVKDEKGGEAWKGLAAGQRVELVRAWLEGVRQRLGCTPVIYTNAAFAAELLPQVESLSAYPLWVAHYDVAEPKMPKGWKSWTFWQSHVDQSQPKPLYGGIHTDVDINRFRGTLDELRAFCVPVSQQKAA